jgi:ABC-type phosphate transport system substrate-binding protein
MKKSALKYILAVIFPISSIIYQGCDYSKVRSVTTIGETTIEVDESISPVVKKEADEFMRLNTESKINMNIRTSNEVMADLLNGDIKTVIVSRDFTPAENEHISKFNIEVKKHVLAVDAIGVIVNTSNPIRNIDYKELKGIFAGESENWKDLQGDNKDIYKGKIKVFIARGNAAIHDIFKEKVLAGKEYGKYDVPCSTSTQMLEEIKKDKDAVGFITMSWITRFADTLDTAVKTLRIAEVDSLGRVGENYVGLHQAYIANGEYPLAIKIYIFSTDYGMNVSTGLISFMLAYDGQKIVLNSGLVPVTQPVRIIQLN